MNYIAIVDDEFLHNFDLTDGGLAVIVKDRYGKHQEVKLKPIQRPTITNPEGVCLYLTQGHIDCLLEYEKQQMLQEALDRFMDNLSNPVQCCGTCKHIRSIMNSDKFECLCKFTNKPVNITDGTECATYEDKEEKTN